MKNRSLGEFADGDGSYGAKLLFGNGHAITDRPNIAISTSIVLASGAAPRITV